jgi:HK97 family phage prohead protease
MSKTSREVRSFKAAQPFTVRTLQDGRKQVSGYAIVWNSLSQDLGGFTEICSPGMLTRTLRENPDVLILRDHKQELLLGRTTAGTLALRTDNTGLAFTVTLPATAIGDDTYENVKLGNLQGVSFGFSTVEDSWAVDSDGNVVRTLLDIDLYEISPCSFPAYMATSVDARAKAHAAELRSTSRRDDDDDDGDVDCNPDSPDYDELLCDADDDDDEDRSCGCSCRSCRDLNDCANCYSIRCSERSCRDAGCPMQDAQRSDDLRIRKLFHHRHLNNQASSQ